MLKPQTARSAGVGIENLANLNATSFPLTEVASEGRVQNAMYIFPQVTLNALTGPKHWLHFRLGVLAAWCVAAGVLFAPSVPDAALYGQWTPVLGGFRAYEGRLLSATVGPLTVPHGLVPDQERLRSLLMDEAPIETRFMVGRRPSALAPVFHVFDENRQMACVLGVDQDEVVVSPRLRADDVRLDRPEANTP